MPPLARGGTWSDRVCTLLVPLTIGGIPEHMYNLDYWVAMGSASPTILLAAIIALGGVLPAARKRQQNSPSPAPAVIGYAAMMLQASIFYLALYSLGSKQNAVPTAVATGLEIAATLLLIFASGIAAGVQGRKEEREEEAPGSPR